MIVMKDNIILIGFMGAGKTSVGKYLSVQRPLLDVDQMIEQAAGMSIRDIFASQGEEAFRRLETRVLKELCEDTEHAIISTGGGLPLRVENRELLAKLGTVVFLRVTTDTVLKRLAGDTTRPLLQGADKEQKVMALLAERNTVYEQAAHIVIDVDDKTLSQIGQELSEGVLRLQKKGQGAG